MNKRHLRILSNKRVVHDFHILAFQKQVKDSPWCFWFWNFRKMFSFRGS